MYLIYLKETDDKTAIITIILMISIMKPICWYITPKNFITST